MKTRFQGPEASPGFLMWRAALAWQRDIAAALEPVGLTHSQFVLLACTQWLEERGDGASQVMVATQAGMDVKTASQVLRRLEQAGLVQTARQSVGLPQSHLIQGISGEGGVECLHDIGLGATVAYKNEPHGGKSARFVARGPTTTVRSSSPKDLRPVPSAPSQLQG